MGKKKKKTFKVWCFYCEREFEDEKILIQHQKAKHFKCHVCHKKLSTAGGMVVHVLQVHKESITKVPNAKPDRESTELEIFGMEGIPPEILAAHDGSELVDEEERPSKLVRVEIPPPSAYGGIVMGSSALGMAPQPLYTAIPPVYAPPPPGAPRPPSWPPQPPMNQPWSSMPMPGQGLMPSRPPQPPQPLFPIQNVRPSPANSSPAVPGLSQPLFPIRPPSSTSPPPPSSQPLFPLGAPANGIPSGHLSPTLPPPPGLTSSPLAPRPPGDEGQSLVSNLTASSPMSSARPPMPPPHLYGGIPLMPPPISHMYASGPNTGGPSIGPPPVISNKPPVPPGTVTEVYLVWDDELMSMEERRAALPQNQVQEDEVQMNTVDAAIDRRILESSLRMEFEVA